MFTCPSRESTPTNDSNNGFLTVPIGHESVTTSQHTKYQDPEIKAAKWHSGMHY